MRKAVKIIIYIVLPVILALLILVLIALPYGIKKYVNKHGAEYTGRKMSVQDVKINYFSATFNIIDFKMLEADGQAAFVSFDTLMVHIAPFPLFSSKLVVRQIRLVKPFVNLVRKDSLYNFDDIIAFVNSKPKAKADSLSKPSSPFEYVLNKISLEQGNLIFTDKGVNYTTTLKDLNFLIPNISFNQDEVKDTGIKFHFENGGSFQAKTNFNQKNGSYFADFSVDKLDISPFMPYVKDYFKLKSIEGLLGGEFHLSGNTNNLDSILVRGKGEVKDFAAKDLAGPKGGRRQTGQCDPGRHLSDEVRLSVWYHPVCPNLIFTWN